MTGAGGDDLVIKVPVGTQVLADDEERSLLADFTEVGQRIVFLKGGDGGRGNASYKTSTNRTPRQHGTGWPGEEMYVWLRLKLLADFGLVGLPNAGKSTFLNRTTNAVAKVGEYPFTTLRPQLGVVSHKGREFVLADIPGLIEGAAEGAGIGDRFLGHVERTRVLLHLVDAAGEDPIEAYRVVRGELEAYGAGLEDKPEVLALSRADLVEPKDMAKLAKKLAKVGGVTAVRRLRRDRRRARALARRHPRRGRRRQGGRGRACPRGRVVAALKLALTGATGFVGARLLDLALAEGHEVRALTRRPQPPRDGVTWVEGALDDPAALAALVEGADAVIHVAGVINAPDAAGFEAGNVDRHRGDARRRRAGRCRALRPCQFARRARAGAVALRREQGAVRSAGRRRRRCRPPSSARRRSTGPATAKRSSCSRWRSAGWSCCRPRAGCR